MDRRTFLGALAGAALLVVSRQALAASSIKNIVHEPRGTTFYFALEHAPFPAPGYGYKDDTVIVFVPSFYRYAKHEGVQAIVHFHGHSSTAERAMNVHELRGQLFDSKQNAILVVPQGPVNAPDSSIGKLEQPLGFVRMLDDVLEGLSTHEARNALGATAIPAGASIGKVSVSAHSGGYHAAACALRFGGVEVHEVYLFDALYNESEAFRAWVLAGAGRPERSRHKLVTYFTGGTTEANSRQLLTELGKAGVKCATEAVEGTLTRAEFTRADAVSVHTSLWHNQVTWETNALRDCLYASAFTRRLRTSWFEHKDDARTIDRRR
jgi:hypothetical protein